MKTDEELREMAEAVFKGAPYKETNVYEAERRALYNAGLRDAAEVCELQARLDWNDDRRIQAKANASAIRALIEEPR